MHDSLIVYALSYFFLNDLVSMVSIGFIIFLTVCIALLTLIKKWSEGY